MTWPAILVFSVMSVIYQRGRLSVYPTLEFPWEIGIMPPNKEVTSWYYATIMIANYNISRIICRWCCWALFLYVDTLSVTYYLHQTSTHTITRLRPRQNCRHFADIFKRIFLNENVWISKFVPKVRVNNIPALVQIMAWRRPGDKPLSEPMTVSSLTHNTYMRHSASLS